MLSCRPSRSPIRAPSRRWWPTAVGLAALVATAAAGAQTSDLSAIPWYTVEIVIFERPQELGIDEELWPPDPGQPPLDGSIELNDAAALAMSDDAPGGGSLPLAFQLLPPGEHQLAGVWRRLARSRDYRPLWHGAWRQPGFDQTEAQPAHIRIWRPRQRPDGDAGLGLTNPVEAAVDGTVLLYRARYLHVQFDLIFSPLEPVLVQPTAIAPAPASESEPAPAESTVFEFGQLDLEPAPTLGVASPLRFRLTTSRRMRSKETHYIDHPLFGILVLVTPFELPTPPGTPAPEGQASTASSAQQ